MSPASGHPWHSLAPAEAARVLGSHAESGLSAAEARRRLDRYGPNRLAEERGRGPLPVLVDQFRSFLIWLLLAAAALALLIGHHVDAAVIVAVVAANTALGFFQEYRAERAMAALRGMLAQRAEVVRDGQRQEIAAEELVPGDVVVLSAGAKVPADGRLSAVEALEVDESALTGESAPVAKAAGALTDPDLPAADRINLAYMNTVVTRGRARLLVTETGMATRTGRLAGELEAGEEPPTLLQRQLDGLGRRLAAVAGAVIALITVAGLLRGQPWTEVVLTAIALAVAAIPEGLPAVVTVTLALGMRRMAARHALVKRLAGVETLGATTVIGSDKTGTLTLNQMTVRRLFFRGRDLAVTGEGYTPRGEVVAADGGSVPDLDPLLLPAALCNDSDYGEDGVLGDPLEGALLVLADKGGLDRAAATQAQPRVAEVPFDSEAKLMATEHRAGDGGRVYLKGAPEAVLARCDYWLGPDGTRPLHEADRQRLQEAAEAMAGDGLRVLALAYGERSAPVGEGTAPEGMGLPEKGLILSGLAGLLDPPRPEAAQAVARCRRAGIAVKMVTGDHAATARAIARDLGITGEVLSGVDLDRLSDAELGERLGETGVLARVAPEHKVRLVRVWRERGEVVAVTGDGVNDAPALRRADMGVAMGAGGTDVARQAAGMVLTDDNFASIVAAVEEGRTIYDNILKFLRFQLSTNVGAIASVAAAPLAGLPLPFNPVQILWVNIIMDGPPAMALGVDPARPGVMDEPPRRTGEPILTPWRLLKLGGYGATMAVGTLGVLAWGLAALPEVQALTLAFTTFVLFQVFNAFNARAGGFTALSPYMLSNGKLWAALTGVVALQALVVHWPPAQTAFHTVDLTAGQWGLAAAVAASVVVLDEGRKLLGRLRRR